MSRPTHSEREAMIDAAIMRLVNGQKEYMDLYSGSRASLESYDMDRAAREGLPVMQSHDTRYSKRWLPTSPDRRHKDTVTDGVTIPASVRAKVVKVTSADGTVTYRAASSFRKTRNTTRRITRTTATMHHTLSISAADLPAIGNVE